MTMTKEKIIEALRAFVRTRPYLDPRNYEDIRTYRADTRMLTRERHHANRLLDAIARRSSVTADDILQATKKLYSGRLSIQENKTGEISIDYVPGQYYPTEYRAAVCVALATALKIRYQIEPFYPRLSCEEWARREFGPAIAEWFM
jgi:hypothetical protein